MFTVEVGKRGREEDFNIENLEMTHQDCMGGKIKLKSGSEILKERKGYVYYYMLTCSRCTMQVCIDKDSGTAAELIKTAIDGNERKAKGFILERLEYDYQARDVEITVTQKS